MKLLTEVIAVLSSAMLGRVTSPWSQPAPSRIYGFEVYRLLFFFRSLSVTFSDCVLAVPPLGVKVTENRTLSL